MQSDSICREESFVREQRSRGALEWQRGRGWCLTGQTHTFSLHPSGWQHLWLHWRSNFIRKSCPFHETVDSKTFSISILNAIKLWHSVRLGHSADHCTGMMGVTLSRRQMWISSNDTQTTTRLLLSHERNNNLEKRLLYKERRRLIPNRRQRGIEDALIQRNLQRNLTKLILI